MCNPEAIGGMNQYGNNSIQIANISGGIVNINNVSLDVSQYTHFEALSLYIKEIESSDLSSVEKAALIKNAPETIRKAQGTIQDNLPPRNIYFSGRASVIEQIEATLLPQSHSRVQALIGLGGIGKTAIAINYAHINKNKYKDGVCWIDAQTNSSIINSFIDFALKIELIRDKNAYSVEQITRILLDWFSQHNEFLVILDNVECIYDVKMYTPCTGYILITTRLQNLRLSNVKNATPINLDVFTEDEAVNFLYNDHRIENLKKDKNDVKVLTQRLGCFPLAIEQAIAYLSQNKRIGVKGYISRLAKHGLIPFGSEFSKPTEYKETIKTTFDISIEKLSKDAIHFLKNLLYEGYFG